MMSLRYLKYTFDLSDEVVVEDWLQNPYWRYLSGMRYFEHEVPLESSSMSRWQGRVGVEENFRFLERIFSLRRVSDPW